MKTNNVSFGALMLEKKNFNTTTRKLVGQVLYSEELPTKFINNMEKLHTDIYVGANKDGSAYMKLRTAAGLTYNFVPKSYDEKTESTKNYAVGFSPNDSYMDINSKVANFVARAYTLKEALENEPENIAKKAFYNTTSEKDMMSKSGKISKPYNLPDAIRIAGTPQVTTKDFLRK